MVSYMRRLPRAHEPGTTFHYNTGETDLVGMLVSKATGKSLAAVRLGEDLEALRHGARRGLDARSAAGHERGGCCISMTLRDYARFGQFILEGGKAGGPEAPGRSCPTAGWPKRPASSITGGALPQGIGYGYFWWVGSSGGFAASASSASPSPPSPPTG